MVQCLKQKGHIVAVTGDGIHDAQHSRKLILDSLWEFKAPKSPKRFTVNVAALVINYVAIGEVPLTTVQQLLWVNLITDKLDALALATEKPTMDLMAKPPVGRTKPLITNVMWGNLLAQALNQIAVLLTL
ncbi:hypothetical protein Fmac_003109 [Flemingia macrophylla]|uniref:Cation-transporting P-type ATPase C-terminal domain-containing protein n=1 Tax=Flemingia macrophylla TaxID=520843 RepID=A0ABD1NLU8_9FABA